MGLDTAELIHKIEIHFAIRIPNKEAANTNTVKEVYEMVLGHLPAHTDHQKIYTDVVRLVSEQAGMEPHEIKPYHSLTNDLGLD